MRALIITNSITRRDAKSLDKYLAEIAKYDVLSPDEELELFKLIRKGDEGALHKILMHNLRFVVSVAKQYQHVGFWLGDLINEGNIGLIKAARRFDETRGFKFISYAVWWIRQAMLKAINEKGRKIRLPINHQSVSTKVLKASVRFLQEEEREPSVGELAEITGFSEEVVQKSKETHKMCSSLDAPIDQDSSISLSHFMEDSTIKQPDFELGIRASQQQEVKHLLTKVSAREATVLSLYYGIGQKYPMTLKDIGERIGTSRERIRQIRDKGLRKLRSSYEKMYSNY